MASPSPQPSPPRSPSTAPLNLTIRFATSLPDLALTLPSPSTTSVHSLKCQIRSLRPHETQSRRLRLIHAGKVLSDSSPVDDALKVHLLSSPPRDDDDDGVPDRNYTAKGKAPLREVETQEVPRVYIHCAIGHVLSAAELAQEEETAAASELAIGEDDAAAGVNGPRPPRARFDQHGSNSAATTSARPRGFDRLLAAGFTAPEIAALRAQFLRLQAYTHTPDTMPTASELRILEDRWIDESAGPGLDSFGDGLGSAAAEGEAGAAGSALDDMLWGNVLGFFWPLGAVAWLLREEGVWSSRRQMAVFTGIMVNVAFSILRVTS